MKPNAQASITCFINKNYYAQEKLSLIFAAMLRWFSILCSMTYILATTNVAEVLKVPVFIEHLMEYEGNFMEFMVEHYDNHKPDSDWNTDQKLPFINPPVVLMIHAQLPEITFHFEQIKEFKVSQKTTSYQEKDFSNTYLSRIFQPPRFC